MSTTASQPVWSFDPLKAPFPVFGGKSRVSDEVGRRIDGEFGTPSWDPVDNWIEPFAFSAVCTLRQRVHRVETINDRNAFVSNFWRAVRADPAAVARHADWPVNEVDLHARHRWLVGSNHANRMLARVREDPEAYDTKIAGWWCWGACCWIGSGWCDETHRNSRSDTRPDLGGQLVTGALARGVMERWAPSPQLPDLAGDAGATGRGVCSNQAHKRVKLSGNAPVGVTAHGPKERQPGLAQNGWGVNAAGQAKRPRLAAFDSGGLGIHNAPDDTHRPQLTDEYGRGRGVNGNDAAGTCGERRAWLTAWMEALADRLRPVRVCCGHWSRVCDSPSTMTRPGTTGVLLDPPYRVALGDGTKNRSAHIYASDRHQDINALCDEVQSWCLKWGPDPAVRIALCGLEGEYPEIDRLVGPGGWDVFAWKSNGGYGNRKGGAENVNAARERIWFSPGCLRPGSGEPSLWE